MTNQDKQREAVHDEGLTVAYLKGVQDGKDKAKEEFEKKLEGLEDIICKWWVEDSTRCKVGMLASAIRTYLIKAEKV